MGKINLNKRALESLPVPANKYALYRDANVRGLGVKVEPTGTKTFFWSRKGGGRLHWKTIGECDAVTLEDAHAQASEYNSILARWKSGGCVGDAPFTRPQAMTLAEAAQAYIDRHVRTNAKDPAAAEKTINWQLNRYAVRLLERRLDQITRADVVRLRDDLREKHGLHASNHALRTFKAIVNWTIRDGAFTGANPFTGVQLGRTSPRVRFLNAAELGRLAAALQDPKLNRDARDVIHLLLFTGCRKSEVMGATWAQVDFDAKTLLLPDPKNREPRLVALSTETVRILEERRDDALQAAEASGLEMPKYVFPSWSGKGRMVDPRKSWDAIRTAAGLTNFRLHDLRHTQASWQTALGASLLVVGKSLGHKALSSTARYSHVDLTPVRASVQAAQNAMLQAMRKRPALPPAAKPKKAARRA
jgi:integrase